MRNITFDVHMYKMLSPKLVEIIILIAMLKVT